MRLPRVRFTIWRLMVAVAIVALLIVGSRQGVSWYRISSKAADEVAGLRPILVYSRRDYDEPAAVSKRRIHNREFEEGMLETQKRRLARERRTEEYIIQLIANYERRIYSPWLPVKPDPPEPD
jgi:hypothetical protein